MHTIEEMVRQHIAQNFLFSSKGYPYPDDASFLEKPKYIEIGTELPKTPSGKIKKTDLHAQSS